MSETINSGGWPPPYTVRRSKRARRLSLRILPGRGLEIVIPQGAAEEDGLRLLDRHKRWVERHLAAGQVTGQAPQARGAFEVPSMLTLHGGRMLVRLDWGFSFTGGPPMGRLAPADSQTLSRLAAVIEPRKMNGVAPLVFCSEPDAFYFLRLKSSTKRAMLATLRQWIKLYAKDTLTPRLEQLSARYDLPYRQLRIGLQKSRWGSYSGRGVLSLNAKLVFLPDRLTDLIVLHELCHSRHLNHSAKFWNLLECIEPQARMLDRAISAYGQLVPAWA